MKPPVPETPPTRPEEKPKVKRYYRKRMELYLLVDRVRLWVSRNGSLHSIRSLERREDHINIVTYCGKEFVVRNSRNSRAARYLRNKYFSQICPACGIPDWRLSKFSATRFNRHFGSSLTGKDAPGKDNR